MPATAERREVILEQAHITLRFVGMVEAHDEEAGGVDEDGTITTYADGAHFHIEEGEVEDTHTGVVLDLAPGVYVLDGDGFRQDTSV